MVIEAVLVLFFSTSTICETTVHVDVVIVGAGQAGMAAAHQLSTLGHSVHVIEATDHVGGRTRNYDVGNRKFDAATDDAFEVGGTWLSPQHSAALGLCKELGIEVYNASFVDDTAVNGKGDSESSGESWPWWYWGPSYPEDQMKRVSHTVFHGVNGTFMFKAPNDLMEHIDSKSVNELNAAAGIIARGTAAISEKCWNTQGTPTLWRTLDLDSTAGALGKSLQPESQQILRNCIHTHNAQEPEEVGFMYNLFSFKGCNSGGPDNKYRVRGGTQAIPLASAARLGRKHITLESPVQLIKANSTGVHVRTKAGFDVEGLAVVVTGPPPSVLGIEFSPPLPGVHAQLLQRMPMGTSLKFAAVYSEGPWWRQAGFQGDILATLLPKNLSLPGTNIPLFVQCMDHSPFSRKLGIIACFVEGRQNLYFTTLSQDTQESLMRSFLRMSFAKAFSGARVEVHEPAFFVAHNWADQPFARGAYTGYFPPGVISVPEYWAAYQDMEKLPNVFLAGSDYHTGWGNGYIEGAIRSGQRATALVHSRLRPSNWRHTTQDQQLDARHTSATFHV